MLNLALVYSDVFVFLESSKSRGRFMAGRRITCVTCHVLVTLVTVLINFLCWWQSEINSSIQLFATSFEMSFLITYYLVTDTGGRWGTSLLPLSVASNLSWAWFSFYSCLSWLLLSLACRSLVASKLLCYDSFTFLLLTVSPHISCDWHFFACSILQSLAYNRRQIVLENRKNMKS